MESEEPSKGKLSVKHSIKYICNLITALGVTGLTPEILRLAKFNKLESPQCLLHALRSIITKNTSGKHLLEDSSDDKVLGFVKFHLALWGYPPHSPFLKLHWGDQGISRQYLLALGWMISHCELIARGLEHRFQSLRGDCGGAPLPDDYPRDMAESQEGLLRGKNAECAAKDYVRRMVDATNRVDGEALQTEARVEQVLLLYGQVRTSLNAIEALQQSKVKKMHKLELVQVKAGIRDTHTPYELYLLQNGKQLDLHCLAIAIAKAIEEETQACHEHEALFWQWMESVAREELLRPSTLHCHNLTGVTEVELFPALEDLKQLLTSSKQKIETTSCCEPQDSEMTISESLKGTVLVEDVYSSDKSILPQLIEEIVEDLLRSPIFVYKPNKRLDTKTITATSKRAEENDPQSVVFKIKRLAEVNQITRSILAKTQAKNNAVVIEMIKPLMEDESYVVVGF